MDKKKSKKTMVLPRGMLRRNYSKNGVGGSWVMRLRVVPDSRQVAQAVEIGLGTRDFEEAQQRAVNLLNAMDVLGWRYCCSVHALDGTHIEYDDIRRWRRQVRELTRQHGKDVTPGARSCTPLLPGLELYCDE